MLKEIILRCDGPIATIYHPNPNIRIYYSVYLGMN